MPLKWTKTNPNKQGYYWRRLFFGDGKKTTAVMICVIEDTRESLKWFWADEYNCSCNSFLENNDFEYQPVLPPIDLATVSRDFVFEGL